MALFRIFRAGRVIAMSQFDLQVGAVE